MLQLEKSSVDAERIEAYLKLDLDAEGKFGEVWLMLSSDFLYRLNASDGSVESHALEEIEQLSVDSLATINRIVLKISGEPKLFALCTNSVKKKIFCFVDVFERFKKGESVPEDDPIFEEFDVYCPKCGKPYTDRSRRICLDCLDKKSLLVRVLKYFAPYKLNIVVIFLTAAATCGLTLLSPWLAGTFLFDRVLSPTESDPFIRGNVLLGAGLILGCAILSVTMQIIRTRVNATMSNFATLSMKMDVFKVMQSLSLSFFNNNQTGRLINSVDNDTLQIRNFCTGSVPALIINTINFIVAAAMMFVFNWKLALVVFIPVPIILLILKRGIPKLDVAYTLRWRRRRSMLAMLNDNLVGIRVVKAFAKEDAETNRFVGLSQRYAKAALKVNLIHLLVFPLIAYLIRVSGKAVWGFGGIMVMDKIMGYGAFLTFISYTTLIFDPLNFFATVADAFTSTINSVQKVFDVIDTAPDITESPDAHVPEKFEGAIEFENVNFFYNPNRPILKDVSMKVRPGESVGLVGRTGAGKSTLVNLILRLYDVKSGSIKIDGVNVKDLPIDFIRKNFAVVSQEVFIFRGTVADNIRYARSDATDDEVIAAARAANAHDFI
ncbi:MAG: ABC transporter ATP-binding protein, partial [Clostridia bacterium]|nr:ABC transporter ATP-binding protein [Clostridia bacterium]